MTAAVETPADYSERAYRPLLDILVEKVGQPLPDGYDVWSFRAVHPDFTSSRGFRWPFPGNVATASGPFLNHRGSCPNAQGDGICVATTAGGMASGGIAAGGPVLLTAHRTADVLGDDEPGKLRVTRALVVEVVWLQSADLRSADLWSANLRFADLQSANLAGAYGCDCGCTKLPDGWKVAKSGLVVRADS